MNTQKRSQFIVREIQSQAELALCLALDHSYATDHVWQMDLRDEGEETVVRYRTVRLPRLMDVPYPRERDQLVVSWKKLDCFLVAEAGNIILGYANLRIDTVPTRGWIQDLVVGKAYRRRRIGSALLEQVTRWALLHQIDHLTLEMQTKNYPAIQFARAKGFVFCGFNDRHYLDQDIAVFFGKKL
jgi:GNAT superfamily N-acetyltransferase